MRHVGVDILEDRRKEGEDKRQTRVAEFEPSLNVVTVSVQKVTPLTTHPIQNADVICILLGMYCLRRLQVHNLSPCSKLYKIREIHPALMPKVALLATAKPVKATDPNGPSDRNEIWRSLSFSPCFHTCNVMLV